MRRKTSLRACFAALLLVISLIITAGAKTMTVDNDAPADFNNIRAAMYYAIDGDTVVIHPGLYTGPDNRNIDFEGKAVTLRSTNPDDADIVESTIIECGGLGRAFQFVSGERPSSVLDGLTIMNGFSTRYGGAIYCEGSGPAIKNCIFAENVAEKGGSIRCESDSSIIIARCRFTGNGAGIVGGAVSCQGSLAVITDCIFSDNSIFRYPCNHYGGAISVSSSSVTVSDSTFSDNSALEYGGAIACYGESELIADNCSFVRCYATYGGGAICKLSRDGSGVTLINCRFIANSTELEGGALFFAGAASVRKCLFAGNSSAWVSGVLATWRATVSIGNCTFAGNSAAESNTLYADKGCEPTHMVCADASEIHVANTIIWDGEESVGEANESMIDFSFCNMTGAPAEQGSIYTDPCFASPGHWADASDLGSIVEPNDPNAVWVHGDYHLKSQGGRWEPNEGRWVRDDVTSLCIDSGNPASAVGLEAFPNGGIVNMGFYGGTAEASKSYFGQGSCETIVAGDVNGDCAVDGRDFAIMAGHWLSDNTIWPSGRATNPNPPDGAAGVETNIVLNWTPGPGVVTHDVYFGTTSPGLFQGNQTEPNIELWTLDYDQTYYWRIDEVNDVGTTTGTVWSFRTEPRPMAASHPNPPDGGTNSRENLILRWEPGRGALSHDIYFGEESPGAFQGNQEETTFQAGSLYPMGELYPFRTYYWRVDEVNEVGKTTGPVWTFTIEPEKARTCFPGETLVWVDGGMVEISEVVVGGMVDKAAVWAAITDLHRTVCGRQIEHIDVHDEFDYWDRYDIVFENGNTLSVADSHYFLLDSGQWTPLQKLGAGSKLSTLEGTVTIKTIRMSKSAGTVYNLKIKDSDRYLVGKDGIIVRDW